MSAFLTGQALASVAVMLLAALVCGTLRRSSAAQRHFVWSAAFVALLAIPAVAMLISAFLPEQKQQPKATTGVVVTYRYAQTAAPAPQTGAGTTVPWKDFAAALWLAGTVLLLARTASGLLTCASRRRRASSLPSAAGLTVELTTTLDINSRVWVLESADVSVAETFGVVSPTVLLPAGSRQWDSEALRLVLLHEFIHIQRRDWVVQVTARIAVALFWFNPLCWYALRRLCEEREHACDDGVIRAGVAQSSYASQFVEIAKAARAESPALVIAMVRPSNLEGRIRAILNPQQNRRSLTLRNRISTLVPAMLVIAAASLVTSPAQTGNARISGTVRDPSGAVVPQAEVVLSGSKGQEMVRTGDTGKFEFAGFPDGKYALKVLRPGFKVFDKQDLEITAAAPVQLDVVLDIGKIFENVEVTAQGQARPQPTRPSTTLQPLVTERRATAMQTAVLDTGSGPNRIRVGGHVQPAKLVQSAAPVYPPPLISQGVEGAVIMQAVIGKNGQVMSLQASNSQVDPDLVQAAHDAVKQWRYEPVLLNGQPVEVVTTITVDFRLKP